MSREVFNEHMKTRISSPMKRDLEAIAEDRHLDLSDVVREALRDFVAKNKVGQPLLPHLNKNQEVSA